MRLSSYRKGNVTLNLRSEPLLRLAFVDPWPLALAIYEGHVDWLRPQQSEDRMLFSELLEQLHRDVDHALCNAGWMGQPMSEWQETSERLASLPLNNGSQNSPYRHADTPSGGHITTVDPLPRLLSWWQSDSIFTFENVPHALAMRGRELIVERQDTKTYKVPLAKLRTSVFSDNGQACCHVFGRNQHVILPVDLTINQTLLRLRPGLT